MGRRIHDGEASCSRGQDTTDPARIDPAAVLSRGGAPRGNHRERLDNRRQNLLINAGYQLLRFTAPDIYDRPEVVVAQVRFVLDVKRA